MMKRERGRKKKRRMNKGLVYPALVVHPFCSKGERCMCACVWVCVCDARPYPVTPPHSPLYLSAQTYRTVITVYHVCTPSLRSMRLVGVNTKRGEGVGGKARMTQEGFVWMLGGWGGCGSRPRAPHHQGGRKGVKALEMMCVSVSVCVRVHVCICVCVCREGQGRGIIKDILIVLSLLSFSLCTHIHTWITHPCPPCLLIVTLPFHGAC